MRTYGLRLDVNCSILFTELPLLERPAAAKAAGFDGIELWWPWDDPVPSDKDADALVAAIADAGVDLVSLNFLAGDIAAGERGLLSIPAARDAFQDNVPAAVELAARLGCQNLNAPYGNRLDPADDKLTAQQDELAIENLRLAARAAATIAATVLIEPINSVDLPLYPIDTTAKAIGLIERAELGASPPGNLRLLADLYHLATMSDDLSETLDRHADLIAHVQVADAPGRGAPGTGTLDFEPLFAQLTEQGYAGWVGLEYVAGDLSDTLEELRMAVDADLVVRSARVALPDGVRAGAVVVRDGVIESVAEYGARVNATAEVDLGDTALLPGLVDTHVHVNEPGRTEWEGFASATAAALAGGITTICDMPLNSIPVTTTVDALSAKVAAARGQCAVDVAFWGGAVPGNADQIGPLLEAGVIGFKCFLVDSGIPDFPPLDRAGLRAAMRELAGSAAPLIVHAEDPGEVSDPAGPSYDAFLASRPPVAERRAIETVISAAAATGARAHIVHLAAGECAALISAAQASGISLTAETCPHYLYFAAEEVPAGHTEFKCCPPVRYAPNREALWRALEAGVIGGIVSDHSPCTADLKKLAEGDFRTAWGGIASLQVALPAVWSVARKRGRTLADVAQWMSRFPAELAGLEGRKGAIAPGADADLVAFDPEAPYPVSAAALLHKNPVSPYDGRTLTGQVRRTWLRGAEVTPGGPRHGRLLRRGGSDLGA